MSGSSANAGAGEGLRVIAYAWNHEGLGHVARLLAVMKGLRELRPETQSFVIAEQESPLLRASGTPFVCIPTFRRSYLQAEAPGIADVADSFREQVGLGVVRSAFATVRPRVALHDTVVSATLNAAALAARIPQVLILRRRRDLHDYLAGIAGELEHFQRIILPHTEAEIPAAEIPAALQDKLVFAGPILGIEAAADVSGVQRRYGMQADVTTVVITGGGGGYVSQERFFDVVTRAVAERAQGPTLGIVLLGTFFIGAIDLPTSNPLIRWRVARHEDQLIDLLRAADVVVTLAGYNTLNEATALGVPTVVVPADRPYDDQAERVRHLRGTVDHVHAVERLAIEEVASVLDPLLRHPSRRRREAGVHIDPSHGRRRAAAAILAAVDEAPSGSSRVATGPGAVETTAALRAGAAARLGEAGLAAPLAEADALLRAVSSAAADPLGAEQQRAFWALVARRAKHEPLSYLTGETHFMNLPFFVNCDVQPPREHMEVVILAALRAIAERSDGARARAVSVVDVGTGCGALAILVALRERRAAPIYAVDVSRAALRVAGWNCARYGVDARVQLLHGSLLEPVPERVEIMIANLPFVRRNQLDELDPGVEAYEPHLAIFGQAETGWELQRQLLAQAPEKVSEDGVLLVTLHVSQEAYARQIAAESFPGAVHEFVDIRPGWSRLLCIRRGPQTAS